MIKKHTKETKEKISNSLKGKRVGNKNPIFGQKRPKHVREAVSKRRMHSVWMHNDLLKKSSQVQKDLILEYSIDGWEYGRKKY